VAKYIRRFLAERAISADEVLDYSFPEVLRLAARERLIGSVEEWIAFRAIRNKTSHAYDSAFAQEAYEAAGRFLVAARSTLERAVERR
jgi:Nucleotidyltransferase substrate binding protein like.